MARTHLLTQPSTMVVSVRQSGVAFPIWQGGFEHVAQLRFHFLARNPRPGIIGRRLDAPLEQFPAQIGVRCQLLMLAQDHEHGFGRIKELPALDPVEQPQGERGQQIGFKSQPTLCDLVAEPRGLFDGMGLVGGIGPFKGVGVGHGVIFHA